MMVKTISSQRSGLKMLPAEYNTESFFVSCRHGTAEKIVVFVSIKHYCSRKSDCPLCDVRYNIETNMYMCMVTHIARVWISPVRLSILHVVS